MWRYLVPLAIFLGIGALFYVGLGRNPNQVSSPLVGKPVPTFSLPSVTDPDNYGGPGSLWAYFCRTKSAEEFVTGEVIP